MKVREHGIALVLVLWITTLLGVMASSFAIGTRNETLLARNLIESAQARCLAEGGIQRAILELLRQDSEQTWPTDGSVQQIEFGGHTVAVAMLDETGKVDLNAAPEGLLDGLLQSIGMDDGLARARLVDAILDWRDTDELRRLNGAEDDDYRASGLPYGAKDSRFESVEELQRVLGMTPALYGKLEGALTVYSYQQAINAAVAPPAVLLAVPGMNAGEIDGYIAVRSSNLAEGLPPPPLPAAAGEYLVAAGTGAVFSIRAEVRLPGGAAAGITAIVSLEPAVAGQLFSILVWKEGIQSD